MTGTDKTADPHAWRERDGRDGDDQLSFDPSTWAGSGAAGPARRRRDRAMPLALAASLVLLLACALLAWSARPGAAQTARPAASRPA